MSVAASKPYRPRARAVWSDVPGEAYPDLTAAARAVGRWRSALVDAVDKPGRTCAGRHWFTSPPAWAVEAAARAEAERRAGIVVRPGRYGRLGPPGPGWRPAEQRYAEGTDGHG